MLEPSIRVLAGLACGARPGLSGIRAVQVDDLIRLAVHFGLVSLLGDALADGGHSGARKAVAAHLLVTARRERLLAFLRRLLDSGASGPPILIKGGALVIGGLLAHRDMADLDVVIPAAAAASWRDAAERTGATWRPSSDYTAGAIVHPDGMIDVHTALPGFVGSEAGPPFDVLRSHAAPSPMPDILVPRAQVAREIAAQHFAFHHGGETGHALRVLQDVAALESEPDGEGLDWGRPGVGDAAARLRVIVRQIRDGNDREPPADDYLAALTGAIGADAYVTFAENVARWIGDKPGLVEKARLVIRRLLPPLAYMRARETEALARTLLRYPLRPFDLARKLIASRRPPDRRSRRWRGVVERLRGRE